MRLLTFFLLFILPLIVSQLVNDKSYFAEDEIDDDVIDEDIEESAVIGEDVESEEEPERTTSPNADTYLLFTKSLYTPGIQLRLPAGHPIEFLVGFANKGEDDFVVESVEASFRYPMDFNYYIQNFSAVRYNKEVKSGQEATFAYSFLPSEFFAGHPIGLNIALNYRDGSGGQFSEAIFNETVQITEIDTGLDGKILFLYILLAGFVVFLLALSRQCLIRSVGRRKRSSSRNQLETGTANSIDVNCEWLPEETLRALQKSTKTTSAKLRRK